MKKEYKINLLPVKRVVLQSESSTSAIRILGYGVTENQ
jgi:hypothetical protein